MTAARGIATRCTWCNHAPHADTCPSQIQTGTDKKPNPKPCPCNRNKEKTA